MFAIETCGSRRTATEDWLPLRNFRFASAHAGECLREGCPWNCKRRTLCGSALQVYFTRLAVSLPAPSLRLLPQRGLCPCCGSTPVSGVVTESGRARGARFLYCSLCATALNHARAVCITCGQSRSVALQGIEGNPGAVKAETRNDCHTYAKTLYQVHDMAVDPFRGRPCDAGPGYSGCRSTHLNNALIAVSCR